MRYIFLIIVAFLFLASNAFAQKVAFKNYSVSSGLPSSEVYMIYQDSKGYIWFCTDAGVCKFDGYVFKTYTSENGLPDNTIFNAFEDSRSRVWFVGMSKKLSFYDAASDSIKSISCNEELVKIIGPSSISSFYSDKNDVIYLGINCSEKFLKILPHHNYQTVLPIVFKNSGWQIYYPEKNRVLWGVIKKGKPTSPVTLNIKNNISSDVQTQVYHLKNHVTTYTSRYRFLVKTIDGFVFSEDNVLYQKTKDGLLRKEMHCSSIISLYVDKENNLWVGTKSKGVLKFNQCDINSTPENYLDKQSVTAVLNDREGGYWFSTLEHGVYYVPSFIFTYYDKSIGLSGDKIYSVISQNNQIYCFAEDESLNVIQDSVIKINNNIKGIRLYNLNNNNDEIFVAGDASYFYNTKTFKKRFVFGADKNQRFFIREAYVSPSGKIYAIYSIGLCEINLETGLATTLIDNNKHNTSIFLQNNDLWFGSADGLFKYKHGKTEQLSKRHPLLKNRIDDIVEDKNKNLWFATKGAGIIIKNGNKIKQLSTKNGLSSNLCKTLLVDSFNTVWVGTNRGISKIIILNDSTYDIENYSNIHGLLSDEINQICIKGNFIYAATNQGVVKFDKNKLYSNKTPPPIYITDFYINDVNSDKSTHAYLKYYENFIRINFLGISYKNPGKITYKYRLLGLDSTWKYTKNTSVQFTTLPPGEYQFVVYAINHDSVSSIESQIIKFTIEKPYWKTWWFIALIILAIGLALYMYFKLRVNRIQKNEEEKTALNKKIAEVELKAIRAQMNPHFIFNSINSIQHYILTNDSDLAYRYLSKFSKLIRNVLENSKYELIQLQKEIETIELYIELEKLRFETKFNHHIYVAPTLDTMVLSISPLLIQPYVENAIWHGLMHKKGVGQLNVYFYDEVDLIKCVIEDDGIGRRKSQLIQANNFKKHKSMAISLNQDRLEIIGNLFNNQLKVSIFDMELEDGSVCGTRVELFIPKINFINHDNSNNS